MMIIRRWEFSCRSIDNANVSPIIFSQVKSTVISDISMLKQLEEKVRWR